MVPCLGTVTGRYSSMIEPENVSVVCRDDLLTKFWTDFDKIFLADVSC